MPIYITSAIDGFRRAGISHPKVRTRHEDGAFSKDQLKALRAEPRLTVEIVDEKPAKAPKPEKPALAAKAGEPDAPTAGAA